MVAREQLLQSDEVAQRLTHLLTVDRDHIIMHPIASRIVAARCGRLCDLALVVGEHQVHTTAVDIELLA